MRGSYIEALQADTMSNISMPASASAMDAPTMDDGRTAVYPLEHNLMPNHIPCGCFYYVCLALQRIRNVPPSLCNTKAYTSMTDLGYLVRQMEPARAVCSCCDNSRSSSTWLKIVINGSVTQDAAILSLYRRVIHQTAAGREGGEFDVAL